MQSEYAERRRGILEIVAEERKEIEKLEAEAQVDGSVEVRRVACEELAEAVKYTSSQRRKSLDHPTQAP